MAKTAYLYARIPKGVEDKLSQIQKLRNLTYKTTAMAWLVEKYIDQALLDTLEEAKDMHQRQIEIQEKELEALRAWQPTAGELGVSPSGKVIPVKKVVQKKRAKPRPASGGVKRRTRKR